MSTLKDIAIKYGTDKFNHGYIDVYESLFKPFANTHIKLLEIGVREGWSHLTWNEYFKNGKIYGIENFASPVFEKNKKRYDFKDIEIFIGDQEDEYFLQTLPIDHLDIIIDDGGHRMSQQQISLGMLVKKLKPGGMYIIEDLHTSNKAMKQYWDDDDETKTTLHVLKTLRNSVYISDENWKYFIERVSSVDFYTNDKLCVIKLKD